MGPGALTALLKKFPAQIDERLIVGFDSSDDAAVYKINEETALIQTVDFFPPIVDDPFAFGQIAAANALSDIYAMGGVPRLALNLLCFPSCLPLEIAAEILAGGQSKVNEAGAIVAGGHTIFDNEPKYGLSVTGFARPGAILTNKGARPGDILVLTKPIGSGILCSAMKAEMLSDSECKRLISQMSSLNRYSSEAVADLYPSACTDVTGFGLLGHTGELADGSGVTAEIFAASVPLLPRAAEFAREGLIPAGAYRNMDYLKDSVGISDGITQELRDCLFDPQTSGGLIFSLSEDKAATLISRLKEKGIESGAIGMITKRKDKAVIVREGLI